MTSYAPNHNRNVSIGSDYKMSEEAQGHQGHFSDPEKQSADLRRGDISRPAPQYTRRRSSFYDKMDDPFDDEADSDVKYRTMHWWQASMIMIAETVSLGILSLPSVLATVGIVPGVIMIIGLGVIATYTGYTIWQFRMAYPHVVNIADAGEVIMGRFGREVFGAGLVILLVFTAGSHILVFTIALNTITQHVTCTIVWAVVALVLFFLCTLPRTLKKVSYLSIGAFISISSACIITMVGVGIERPDPVVQTTVQGVEFATAFVSVTNIVFAYLGHAAFFSFISELKKPEDFPKALFVLQGFDTVFYVVVAVVVYRYAGPDVSSPALGSTAETVKRVAYGIALPTIIVAGVIYIHVAAKYVYVRLFRGTKHMGSNSFKSLGTWVAIVATMWLIAFIIAESIPDFNDLLSLISALFASWFTYGFSGVFWLYINYDQWGANGRKIFLTAVNFSIIALGVAVCGIGLYASGKAIHDGSGSGSWSCADNSKGSA